MENQPKNHIVYGARLAKKFRRNAQLICINKVNNLAKTKKYTIKLVIQLALTTKIFGFIINEVISGGLTNFRFLYII